METQKIKGWLVRDKDDSYKQTLEDCMAASGDIINAIASENAETISQYVSSL